MHHSSRPEIRKKKASHSCEMLCIRIPVNISDGVPLEEKAQEIVDNERKVSSNKFEQVRKLLYELQQRKRPTTAPSTSGRTGRGQNKAPVPPLDVSYTSQRPQSRGATSPQASPTTPALTSAREDPSVSLPIPLSPFVIPLSCHRCSFWRSSPWGILTITWKTCTKRMLK